MKRKILIIILSCLAIVKIYAQKVLIESQDINHPLYTKIDTMQAKKYLKYLTFGNYDSSKVIVFRKYLEPYARQNDPLAQFFYAKTYDLFPLGLSTSEDAKIALEFYEKSAKQNLAIAEYFLYKALKYNFMGLESDIKKSTNYLHRAILHGDSVLKGKGYGNLAKIYHDSKELPVSAKIDSTIVYLNKSLIYSPQDTWTLDFLASLYADKGNYTKAKELYLHSSNSQNHLKIAKWLMEGKVLPKDKITALKILRQKAMIVQKEYERITQYTGSINPILYLNELYCQEEISKEDIGEFLLEWYQRSHCSKK